MAPPSSLRIGRRRGSIPATRASLAWSGMRILVIEDEPKAARYLQRGLGESGFVVDLSGDGEEGLALARMTDYDLLIVDVTLPGRDGWSVVAELRRRKNTPVIFLTARDAVADRVRGLELGADDYLVKPFAFSELLARIRTVLRRGPVRQPVQLHVADLEIDLARQRATRAGQPIRLTSKEFALIALLARRPGEVLSRALIAEMVWGINFETDTNVVEVLVRRLRAKVDEPFATKLIHTERGRGYVLEAR
jgi:two-component system copper resistance phosphate regulon response regulator CusR